MGVRVTIDTSSIEAFSEELQEKVRRVIEQVAPESIATMRLRIARGLNANDSQMPQYSKGYKKFRKKRGRQTTVRDLLFSGRMLGDLHVSSIRKSSRGWVAIVGFASARGRELALYHQRQVFFFGFSPSDVRDIERSIKDKLRRETDG